MGAINKKSNEYAGLIPQDIYDKTPKAVFAAIPRVELPF